MRHRAAAGPGRCAGELIGPPPRSLCDNSVKGEVMKGILAWLIGIPIPIIIILYFLDVF